MKLIIHEDKIEFHAETPHEKDALSKLVKHRNVEAVLVDPWDGNGDQIYLQWQPHPWDRR